MKVYLLTHTKNDKVYSDLVIPELPTAIRIAKSEEVEIINEIEDKNDLPDATLLLEGQYKDGRKFTITTHLL